LITRARLVADARLVAGGAVLTCAAVLLAACGSTSGPSAAGTTPDPKPSATPASSGPSVSTAPPASAATPPAGVAGSWSGYGPCRVLKVTLGLSQRDPAVTYQVIDFTNRGSTTCILYGYPGVSLAAGTPAVPVGLPAAHNTSAPARPVTLTPAGVANALLQISNAPARCAPVRARYLIVYLPNKQGPAKLAYTAAACAKPLRIMQVAAVSLGTGG
jgi:hypothetical protein